MREADSTASSGMRQLAESSLARLRNWDISDAQVKALARSGEAKQTLTFRSPVSGIVTDKKALQGMRFMPGETLYQVTDLSSVWIIADVFEQDIGLVKRGGRARVTVNAYPGKVLEGRITYVYPTLAAGTRTVPVRVELANPGMLLKPAMFVEVELSVDGKAQVLTVPESAIEVAAARPVKVAILPREEAFRIPDLIRTKINLLPEGITEVRSVEIEGLDLQADGGTHVANTSEVRGIRIVDYLSKGRINKRLVIELQEE